MSKDGYVNYVIMQMPISWLCWWETSPTFVIYEQCPQRRPERLLRLINYHLLKLQLWIQQTLRRHSITFSQVNENLIISWVTYLLQKLRPLYVFERHISYHQTNARFLKWYVCLLWTISSAFWYMFSFVEICNQMHKYTYVLSNIMIFKTLELLDVEYNATFTNSGIYWNLNSRPLAKQSSMLDHKLLAHTKNILAFLLYYTR